MGDLPTIHPRKGSSFKYSIWLKNVLFGTTTFNENVLNDVYPTYLSEIQGTQVERENMFSASYEFEKTYFVKVITHRHLKAHQIFTWWRNKIFSTNRVGKPFASFDTPLEMAKYEYEAATQINETTNAIPTPYDYALLNADSNSRTATILYEFVSNAGKVHDDSKSLKGFDHILQSLRELHNNGFVHTTVPNHVIETIPTGEPYLTDPVGAVKPTEKAALHVIGFDIVSLMSVYTPIIGTVPALNAIADYYTDLELVAAHKTTPTVQYCVSGHQPWVVRQIRSSIDEFIDESAIEEYEQVIAASRNTGVEEGTVENKSGDVLESASTAPNESTTQDSIPLFLQEFVNTINNRENNTSTTKPTPETNTSETTTGIDETPLRITKRKTQSLTQTQHAREENTHNTSELETPESLDRETHNDSEENNEQTTTDTNSGLRDSLTRILSRDTESDVTDADDDMSNEAKGE